MPVTTRGQALLQMTHLQFYHLLQLLMFVAVKINIANRATYKSFFMPNAVPGNSATPASDNSFS